MQESKPHAQVFTQTYTQHTQQQVTTMSQLISDQINLLNLSVLLTALDLLLDMCFRIDLITLLNPSKYKLTPVQSK